VVNKVFISELSLESSEELRDESGEERDDREEFDKEKLYEE